MNIPNISPIAYRSFVHLLTITYNKTYLGLKNRLKQISHMFTIIIEITWLRC